MSSKMICGTLLVVGLCVPAPVQGQGSERLLAAEAQWDQKVGFEQRIIGGKPVPHKENPWQVGLLSARVTNNQVAQFCGGTIVGARWVVTAAHCVDRGTTPKQVQVLAGTDSLEKGGTRLTVTTIIVHDQWKKTKNLNDFDIALLETENDLGKNLLPGDTATTEHPATLMVRVTGWGRTSKTSSLGSKTLQGIEVPYVTRATCNRFESYDGEITENMICAGIQKGGVDSCQGDSGGPASATIDGTRRLVGIVSWGEGCALPNKYGVYTNVSKFGQWVAEQTKGAVKW
jgi:secreted trypsin-like serine protease